MPRSRAIDRALEYFDSGAFLTDLERRVAIPTESQSQKPVERQRRLRSYLTTEMAPAAARLGCTTRIVDNPVAGGGPFLIATRHEGEGLPTVLTYGHADVVPGEAHRWRSGLEPWRLVVEGDRWYGRGTAVFARWASSNRLRRAESASRTPDVSSRSMKRPIATMGSRSCLSDREAC